MPSLPSSDGSRGEHGIEHRPTKVDHPRSEEDQGSLQWTDPPTNGQVERMSRTIEEATIRRRHHADHDQLRAHLRDFLDACFARRLKTLGGLTASELTCKLRASEPQRFRLDPTRQMPGLNT